MRRKLLIVDDEKGIVDMLAGYFAAWYDVLTAYSGGEALQKVAACPDLILLDINMPGMDGLAICRNIREYVTCPILFLTARVESADKIGGFRAGTQKIEEIVKQRFPKARTLRMDLDTTRSKNGYEQILSAFANQEADILIGTQMIVKGHDFPNVTLVGILAADLSLYTGDYRAAERTFQLLTQAAGRAGRGSSAGEVMIQTYNPGHYSIVAAKQQDYQAFYREEIAVRRLMSYPPVSHMALIVFASGKKEDAGRAAGYLAALIKKARIDGLQMIGPASAAVAKVNDIYRNVIYLKHRDYEQLVMLKDRIELFLKDRADMKQITVSFDFNPMNGL